MSATTDIRSWLEGIRAGLGSHAAIFIDYGASDVKDLGDLDDEDVFKLRSQLEAARDRPAPLQVKQIIKHLRIQMATKQAA